MPDIVSYFHCRECIAELPQGIAPREWGQLEIGFTPKGLQVWCRRHDQEIVHFTTEDFQESPNFLALHANAVA